MAGVAPVWCGVVVQWQPVMLRQAARVVVSTRMRSGTEAGAVVGREAGPRAWQHYCR